MKRSMGTKLFLASGAAALALGAAACEIDDAGLDDLNDPAFEDMDMDLDG